LDALEGDEVDASIRRPNGISACPQLALLHEVDRGFQQRGKITVKAILSVLLGTADAAGVLLHPEEHGLRDRRTNQAAARLHKGEFQAFDVAMELRRHLVFASLLRLIRAAKRGIDSRQWCGFSGH
jgi:hypothetical protein